jgi:hypothetical protein
MLRNLRLGTEFGRSASRPPGRLIFAAGGSDFTRPHLTFHCHEHVAPPTLTFLPTHQQTSLDTSDIGAVRVPSSWADLSSPPRSESKPPTLGDFLNGILFLAGSCAMRRVGRRMPTANSLSLARGADRFVPRSIVSSHRLSCLGRHTGDEG